MEKKIVECVGAIARFGDYDAFDPADVDLRVNPGWELLGDTGWVNDYGWNDVPWGQISDALATYSRETCVYPHRGSPAGGATLTPELPAGYCTLLVEHTDDDYNRAHTSETNAWWCLYIFRKTQTPPTPPTPQTSSTDLVTVREAD